MRIRTLRPLSDEEWQAAVIKAARGLGALQEANLRISDRIARTGWVRPGDPRELQRTAEVHGAAGVVFTQALTALWMRRRAGLVSDAKGRYRGTFAHEDTGRKTTRDVEANDLTSAERALRKIEKDLGRRWFPASVRRART